MGLVCMDRNSPDTYTKSTEQNLADTEAFIKHVRGLGSDLVQPVVTPRFVPTCTPELLAGLGEVAQGQAVLVQSHISESHDEVVSTGRIIFSQEWLCWAGQCWLRRAAWLGRLFDNLVCWNAAAADTVASLHPGAY